VREIVRNSRVSLRLRRSVGVFRMRLGRCVAVFFVCAGRSGLVLRVGVSGGVVRMLGVRMSMATSMLGGLFQLDFHLACIAPCASLPNNQSYCGRSAGDINQIEDNSNSRNNSSYGYTHGWQ
jgi:hypothetical protein